MGFEELDIKFMFICVIQIVLSHVRNWYKKAINNRILFSRVFPVFC